MMCDVWSSGQTEEVNSKLGDECMINMAGHRERRFCVEDSTYFIAFGAQWSAQKKQMK